MLFIKKTPDNSIIIVYYSVYCYGIIAHQGLLLTAIFEAIDLVIFCSGLCFCHSRYWKLSDHAVPLKQCTSSRCQHSCVVLPV